MATRKQIKGLVLREGASLNVGERVQVYYNLNKGGFSIKSLDKTNPMKGKVIAHAETVLIENASFHASMATLKRIKAKGQKEVYAVIRGFYIGTPEQCTEADKRGYLNPYITENFIDYDTKEELKTADKVFFYDKFFSYK